MIKRTILLVAAGLVLGAPLAIAGGHATIKVSALPKLVAGKSTTVTFTIHDAVGNPLEELKPVVVAQRGKEKLEFRARPVKTAGGYAADLVLPAGSNWTLTVDSGYCGNTNVMRNVSVLAAAR
jgi:uncharacterized protein (DUF58 family)